MVEHTCVFFFFFQSEPNPETETWIHLAATKTTCNWLPFTTLFKTKWAKCTYKQVLKGAIPLSEIRGMFLNERNTRHVSIKVSQIHSTNEGTSCAPRDQQPKWPALLRFPPERVALFWCFLFKFARFKWKKTVTKRLVTGPFPHEEVVLDYVMCA